MGTIGACRWAVGLHLDHSFSRCSRNRQRTGALADPTTMVEKSGDDSRSDQAGDDETGQRSKTMAMEYFLTVSQLWSQSRAMVSQRLHHCLCSTAQTLNTFNSHSALPHHITITTWRRSEQSHTANFHTRTQIYAGADHKVLYLNLSCGRWLTARISFMAHPETLLAMPDINDPVERFLSVIKFYLSGWHIKPP